MENKSSKTAAMKTIVLHGFSGNAAGLEDFVASLKLEDALAIDLPSFGMNHRTYEKNWRSYVDAVHDTIQAEAGDNQKLYLIGHSHGAMVAFCLAAWYPDIVGRLTLICPVARGSWIARGFLALSSIITATVGRKNMVRLMSFRSMVDLVTYFSKRDCKDNAAYKSLQSMRRKESELYSVEMFSLFDMIPMFEHECGAIKINLPTRVIAADNDLIVSKYDIEWYRTRIGQAEMVRIPGGHVAPATQMESCALACK